MNRPPPRRTLFIAANPIPVGKPSDGLENLPGMVAESRITVRVSADQLATLDELAEEHGGSRSAAVRALLDAAEAGGPPDRMGTEDVLEVLEGHARAGSVPAARELLLRLETDTELERLRALTMD